MGSGDAAVTGGGGAAAAGTTGGDAALGGTDAALDGTPRRGLSWSTALLAAFLVTLGRPRIWPVALAGFLVRGGIVVLLLPVIVLPTPSGLANLFADAVVDLWWGRVPASIVILAVGSVVGFGAWVVLGGLAGARIDLELVPEALADEDLDRPLPAAGGPAIWAGFLVRIVALLPLVLAVAVGIPRIVDAGYLELILPGELATPIAIRIALAVPGTVAAITLAWVAGEVVGGLAVREIAGGRRSALGALWAALGIVVRRPLAVLGTAVVTDLAIVAVMVPSLLAASVAWDRVGFALVARPEVVPMAVAAFVALWLGGLVLVAAAVAWRQAAWTFEAFRVADTAGLTPVAPRPTDRPAATSGPFPPAGESGSL
jgi:hypothetical protein